MNNAEFVIGILVTVAQTALLGVAIWAAWRQETARPTETVVPR